MRSVSAIFSSLRVWNEPAAFGCSIEWFRGTKEYTKDSPYLGSDWLVVRSAAKVVKARFQGGRRGRNGLLHVLRLSKIDALFKPKMSCVFSKSSRSKTSLCPAGLTSDPAPTSLSQPRATGTLQAVTHCTTAQNRQSKQRQLQR